MSILEGTFIVILCFGRVTVVSAKSIQVCVRRLQQLVELAEQTGRGSGGGGGGWEMPRMSKWVEAELLHHPRQQTLLIKFSSPYITSYHSTHTRTARRKCALSCKENSVAYAEGDGTAVVRNTKKKAHRLLVVVCILFVLCCDMCVCLGALSSHHYFERDYSPLLLIFSWWCVIVPRKRLQPGSRRHEEEQ